MMYGESWKAYLILIMTLIMRMLRIFLRILIVIMVIVNLKQLILKIMITYVILNNLSLMRNTMRMKSQMIIFMTLCIVKMKRVSGRKVMFFFENTGDGDCHTFTYEVENPENNNEQIDDKYTENGDLNYDFHIEQNVCSEDV